MVSESEIDDEIDSGFAGFTGMITFHNSHINIHKWIIDSGASDHMCGNRKMIRSSLNIPHSLAINLPNGETSRIDACGCLELKCGLNLKEVLVVPDFRHNLLSVSKLAKSENCRVHFYEQYCVILDNGS